MCAFVVEAKRFVFVMFRIWFNTRRSGIGFFCFFCFFCFIGY